MSVRDTLTDLIFDRQPTSLDKPASGQPADGSETPTKWDTCTESSSMLGLTGCPLSESTPKATPTINPSSFSEVNQEDLKLLLDLSCTEPDEVLAVSFQRVHVYYTDMLVDKYGQTHIADSVGEPALILIDEELDDTERQLTLFHEVLHIIDELFFLELDEKGIRILENSLFQAMPDLFKGE